MEQHLTLVWHTDSFQWWSFYATCPFVCIWMFQRVFGRKGPKATFQILQCWHFQMNNLECRVFCRHWSVQNQLCFCFVFLFHPSLWYRLASVQNVFHPVWKFMHRYHRRWGGVEGSSIVIWNTSKMYFPTVAKKLRGSEYEKLAKKFQEWFFPRYFLLTWSLTFRRVWPTAALLRFQNQIHCHSSKHDQ